MIECNSGQVSIDSYQRLDLEALLVAQLPTCDVRRAGAEFRRVAEPVDEGVVTDCAPAAVVEDLQAAVLCTAIRGHHTLRQAQITLTCSNHVNVSFNAPKFASSV